MIDERKIIAFVEEHIGGFHGARIRRLRELQLRDLLKRKNPYLFRAKNLLIASDLIAELLSAHLSSSEEELFGKFLEAFAIYVNELSFGGVKSSSEGIDLEFSRDGTRYLVSIKSGLHWGNSSQIKQQWAAFHKAIRVLKQNALVQSVQAVEGVCYGRRKPTYKDQVLRVAGQSFWELVSGEAEFYISIVEPLGHRAREMNENFVQLRAAVINEFALQFATDFCVNGTIDWRRLIAFNSGTTASRTQSNDGES